MSEPSFPSQLPADAIPAATVIILRKNPAGGAPQLLLLQRAKTMRFAGGAVVFPGGRIDPADHSLASHSLASAAPLTLEPADAAARIAAIRETLEESGLLLGVNEAVTSTAAAAARALLFEGSPLAEVLDRFGWSLGMDQLVPYARWCPPVARGFDTRFYLANLGTGRVDIAEDGTENTGLFWTTAAGALALVEQGKLSAVFPTLCNLRRIAQFSCYAEIAADALAYPPRLITSSVVSIEGVEHLTIPEGLGYPMISMPLQQARRT